MKLYWLNVLIWNKVFGHGGPAPMRLMTAILCGAGFHGPKDVSTGYTTYLDGSEPDGHTVNVTCSRCGYWYNAPKSKRES